MCLDDSFTTYMKAQQARGFKIGDKVKILRSPTEEDSKGWQDKWLSDVMDDTIGEIGEIEDIDELGIWVTSPSSVTYKGWNYPHTVLEKVEDGNL